MPELPRNDAKWPKWPKEGQLVDCAMGALLGAECNSDDFLGANAK